MVLSYLNLIGQCDGIITNDSDAFLYGARCVYRNFSSDKKVFNQIVISLLFKYFNFFI